MIFYTFDILLYDLVTLKQPYFELRPKLNPLKSVSKVQASYHQQFPDDLNPKIIFIVRNSIFH